MNHIGYYLKLFLVKRKPGQLFFRRKNVQKHLFFQDGELIYVRTNQPQEMLGEVLFRLGRLTEETFDKIEEYVEPNKIIGENLIQNNLISREDLKMGLNYQMREVVLNLFHIFDGVFKMHEKDSFTGDDFDAGLSILVILEDGIRKMAFHPQLQSFFSKKVPFIKNEKFYSRLTEEEKDIFEAIRKESTADSLLRSFNFHPETFWKSLYLFYCLDLIDLRAAENEEDKEERTRFKEKGEEKRLAEVLDFSNKIPDMTYYEILDVSREASSEAIKRSYFDLARKYHPDLFARDLSEEMKKCVDEVFDSITKGYQVLSNEEKRKEYDGKLESPPDNERPGADKQAEVRFRQGKTLYDQGKYREALVLLEEAVRLNENRSRYFLLLAMAQSKIQAYQKKAVENFQRAIKLEPWLPDGYLGLGMLYKKEGLPVIAAKQFKKALAIDSENKGALRELKALDPAYGKKGLKDFLEGLDFFGKGKKTS